MKMTKLEAKKELESEEPVTVLDLEKEMELVAPAAPAYMSQYKGQGRDDFGSDVIEKSYIKMAHEDGENYSLGDWIDSASGDSYGPELVVTICMMQHNWRKFNKDFQLEAESRDGLVWDNGENLNEEEKWKCAFIDMFVLVPNGLGIPFIVSFKGTSFRTGKKLCTMLAKFTKGSGEAIFGRSYTLYTEEAKKGAKTYCVARFKLNPGFNTIDTMALASKARKALHGIQASPNYDADEINIKD